MVNRVVTGAHYGLRDWLIQRVTAAIMAIYILVMAVFLWLQPVVDYDVWTALFSNQVVRTFTLLFMLGLYYHAWVGIRDIVMDYVKSAFIRLMIHILVILALILYVIWTVVILWGM